MTAMHDDAEQGATRHTVRDWRGETVTPPRDDWLADEVPVALMFNGISHTVMMATPTALEDFALGFGLTEGLLATPDELYGVEVVPVANGIELHLEVSSACAWRLKERRRTLAGRTGCGLCGADSLAQVRRELSPVSTFRVAAPTVGLAMQGLREAQTLGRLTGSTHAAAWFDATGRLQAIREDVGRHNALDKLIGHLVRQQVAPSAGFIGITSRASFEMVQKTVCFGAGLLAAVSAPTALAVELAQSHNLLLAGYVRDARLVAYSFADRLHALAPSAVDRLEDVSHGH